MQEEEEQETPSRRKRVGCEQRFSHQRRKEADKIYEHEKIYGLNTINNAYNLPSVVLFSFPCSILGHCTPLSLFKSKMNR